MIRAGRHQRTGWHVAQLEQAVLWLVCLLPLLVPFSLNRNIYLQGLVVILSGLLGWTATTIRLRRRELRPPISFSLLLGLYVLATVVSLLVHPSLRNLFGSPLVYLGSAVLITAPGCGLALYSLPPVKVFRWLYVSFVALAAVSLAYSLPGSWVDGRLGGVFHQADFLAVSMGLGLILGVELWRRQQFRRRWLVCAQTVLAVVLLLSQTRAVIGLMPLIILTMVALSGVPIRRKLLAAGSLTLAFVVAIAAVHALLPSRLSDAGYAVDSVRYRLHLQQYGLADSRHQALIGRGAGEVSQALRCPTLRDPELQATCHQGYYFDSSHNVFLDRVLAFGWPGGLAFTALTGLGLWHGFRGRRIAFAVGGLFIALYFLTNVSSIEIETLFWIMLVGAYLPTASRASASR